MNEMNSINPLERRHTDTNDRRTSMQTAQFPIITRNGICVRADRRRLPDRRVAKIEVDEAHVRAEVFELLFENSKN